MAKVTGTTVLRDPSTLRPVVLHAGDDVPEWAGGLVGDHLIEVAKPKAQAKSTRKSE